MTSHFNFNFHMPLKFRLFFSFLVSLSYCQISVANELVLEDYSQENGSSGVAGNFETIGTGTITFEASPPDRPENAALKLESYQSDWGILHIKDFNSTLDISSYQQLEFSFYSEGNDSARSVAIQLRFKPGTTPYPGGQLPTDNIWSIKEKPFLSEGFDGWKTVSIPLSESNFARETLYNESNVYDLAQLEGIGVLILNNDAGGAGAPVYVDDIKVVSVSSTLSLNVETIEFGTLEPSLDEYRFESAPATVNYAASVSNPWEIRIYTSNDNDVSGLVNGSNNIPIKIDIGADDDALNDLDWSGDENTELSFRFR